MNKILIVLLVIWGAGCSQQREEATKVWDKQKTIDSLFAEIDRGFNIMDSLTRVSDSILAGAFARTYVDTLSPTCLYSTEYEVCQMRGHQYGRWNVYIPDGITCKWCGFAPTK